MIFRNIIDYFFHKFHRIIIEWFIYVRRTANHWRITRLKLIAIHNLVGLLNNASYMDHGFDFYMDQGCGFNMDIQVVRS